MVKVDLTHGRMDSSDLCWQQDKPIWKNIIEASADWFDLDVCYIWPANLTRIIPSCQPSGHRSNVLQGGKHKVMLDSDMTKLEMRLKCMFRRRIVSFGEQGNRSILTPASWRPW